MEKNIAMLQQAIPGINAEDLYVSLKEPATHVFDAIIIRGLLETHFGFQIADSDWDGFLTLSEALDHCYNKKSNGDRNQTKSKVSVRRRHEIRLPQMSNSALSENWLLKEMGDMHWTMLSCGLEQKSSEFTDSLGSRLYAAFVRVNYTISPLNQFRENDTLDIAAAIKRCGNYAYYSTVKGICNDNVVAANLMTSFSARKCGDNAQITRNKPEEKINHIEELPCTPDFYTEHRRLKKGAINEITSGGHSFKITDNVVESTVHNINPYFEINGVGLLYFASYPMIADTCVSAFFKTTLGIRDYDRNYHTTYRDVFYFANCNADDRIIINLNSIEHIGDNMLKMSSSMYRESDGKLMARVFTIKQKANVPAPM